MCKSEDVRPMRGVSLPHGAYFEGEMNRTCGDCSMLVPWDVCSTRHPDFRFGAASFAAWWRFHSCKGQTSACSFFVSDRGRTNCVSGSYTLSFLSSLACKGEMEVFRPTRESDSHWVLISRVRGLERTATAVRLPLGMSVQPDIPICVSALPPSSAKARRIFRPCRGSHLCI